MSSAAQIVSRGEWGGVVSHGNDAGLLVEFYKETVYMEGESLKPENHGKPPIYRDVDMIRITQAGGKSDIRRIVKLDFDGQQPPDPERFPRQWAAFKRQEEQPVSGTPLDQAPFMPKAEILSLKGAGILSIEQLAELPDSAFHNFGMGIRKWRDMAKAYVDNAAKSGVATSQAARIEALEAELANMRAIMANTKPISQADTGEGGEPARRGPGRPPKPKDE